MSTFADMKSQRKSNLSSLIKETEKIKIKGDIDGKYFVPNIKDVDCKIG